MKKPHWQDWVTYFLGPWVFGSPWFIEHPMLTEIPGGGVRAMWNLWFVGLAVVVLAIVAVKAFGVWEEWVNLTLGAWLLVSPWVLGFSTSAALMWNAVIFGTLIIGFAGGPLSPKRDRKRPYIRPASIAHADFPFAAHHL